MSINQRQHIRFSLDIPAILTTADGRRHSTILQQISIGGCFTEWEENIYAGDEFRIEIELPNKNRLPLRCKALYRFENTGIGARFLDITAFEQRLISEIINYRIEQEGIPLVVDPFRAPKKYIGEEDYPELTGLKRRREEMLDEAMSGGPAE
ncbi:MAG: PilZ domain-containing protein [Pyrinomonadaceae bacterium]|jgi:hypothetical protein